MAEAEEVADPTGLRELIFGDAPLESWPPSEDAEAEPWRSFVLARSALRQGDTDEAERLWRAIVAMPGLESRHTLQAWHFLRSIGATPPEDIAKHVLGAVAEVAVPGGHDVLVAYEDGSVRYLNFSGGAVVIDDRIQAVDAPARELLAIAQVIANAIGPWEGPFPPLPEDQTRLTMLTPLGPHFGQGPEAALRQDAAAAAFLDAATRTLIAVVDL